MVSESDKDKIRVQARGILDRFAKRLVGVKASKNKGKNSGKNGVRVEGSGKSCDSDFRKRMFANAPNKDEDRIVVEKANW